MIASSMATSPSAAQRNKPATLPSAGTPMSSSSTDVRGPCARIGQHESNGAIPGRHEGIEHRHLIGHQHRAFGQRCARVACRQHDHRVTQVFDIPRPVLQERIAARAGRRVQDLAG